jgi:hypothetical protein
MKDFLSYISEQSHGLYHNTKSGMLVVRLSGHEPSKHEASKTERGCDDAGCPTALVTEHRMTFARQHSLRFGDDAEAAVALPAGDYTVVVTAPGATPYRQYVTISDGRTSSVNATLRPAEKHEGSLADILRRNMVPKSDRKARSLTLREGDVVVLDESSREHHHDLAWVELTSLRHAKAVLGTPDSAFVDDHPRFGPGSVLREPPEEIGERLENSHRAALQEYLYGNSASVAHWAPVLDKWVKAEAIKAGLYVLQDVDVGPHATLVVGAAGLLCNTLSVHYTGRVEMKGHGPTKIEMNHYVRYGLMSVTGVVSGPWTTVAH